MKKCLITVLTLILSLSSLPMLLLSAGAEGDAPSPLDSYEGTLQYTPSEDGSTVTISYEINGETVSYTVPNKDNYLFGGYAATDDLGRSLYDSAEVGAYDESRRQIGLFYFQWHDEAGDSGTVYNLQHILDTLGPEASDLSNPMYGGIGVYHHFAEPLYGYYYSNDEWVMRKHVELLTNAGVDFLYFDVTNGGAFEHRAIQLMAILHEFNEQGYDAPQVVFYTNTNHGLVIGTLQRAIYQPGLYPDTWYKINDLPVIVAPSGSRRFTVMTTQWPVQEPVGNGVGINTNAWPWIDFEWPQRVYKTTKGAPHAISVSIAQHSGTVRFSDSSLLGNHTNRGRSFVNPDGVPSSDIEAFDAVLKSAYEAWQANPSLSNYGLNFQAQWDYALSTEAPTIMVTSWNEWIAGNWGYFVDSASVEFSRDAEMMRGGYFDNYYVQLFYNIQRAKGTAPILVQDARHPIDVNGSFAQWDDVVVTYTDVCGDVADRDNKGYGGNHYTNTSGRNDIVASKVTADTRNLYVYVQTAEAITAQSTDSSWMQLYLNTDRKTTGWYGYDFIVNYAAKDGSSTTVAAYNGTDGAYGFTPVGDVSYRVEGNEMMIAVPLSLLGIEDYRAIDVEFKWADSDTVYDEMEDFYCDGDVAPLGRLNFVYQNYIPGVTVFETETTAPETTAPTEPGTEPGTEPTVDTPHVSETEPASKGCGSILSLAVLPAAMAAALLLRKKED